MKTLQEKLRIFSRIQEGKNVRVLALGSSSTEHFMAGTHWFDFVDIGFMHKYRRWTDDCSSVDNPEKCLNAGTSNNTTTELLARFDRDVASFKPDLVILMTGINDANPKRNVSLDQFRQNLKEIRRRVRDLGGDVLFLSCYACDLERMTESRPEWAANYALYMAALREVAGEFLLDNFSRWERLRKYDVKAFRLLMRDSRHLNPEGNAVIGLDLLRLLDLPLPDENLPWIRSAVFARNCMDLLEQLEENEK